MVQSKLVGTAYKRALKPLLFQFDAEKVHNITADIASVIGGSKTGLLFLDSMFGYKNDHLHTNVSGIDFKNPIGLAAGFDYNGKFCNVMAPVGFGFNTVGTVTACEYEGNPLPRLGRLPKSKALFVNKGFKSRGADYVYDYLVKNYDANGILGVSVGSSNIPSVSTIDAAIKDYTYTFGKFQSLDFVKYFELNISCPNTAMPESFTSVENYRELVKAVASLKVSQPIFVKMPAEIDYFKAKEIVSISLQYGISTFVFSNLVKDRSNDVLDRNELAQFDGLKGNFSGKPTYNLSNELIKRTYKDFGNKVTIIGCGGVFSAEDAYEKMKCGASLVQLITGMIFEGPQLISEINQGLVALMQRDGFENISSAVGSIAR